MPKLIFSKVKKRLSFDSLRKSRNWVLDRVAGELDIDLELLFQALEALFQLQKHSF